MKILFAAAALVLAGPRPTHVPKLSEEKAKKIALGKVDGEVLNGQLERSQGHWVWSFEIRPVGQPANDKSVREVDVDCDTGVIVSVGTEDQEGD